MPEKTATGCHRRGMASAGQRADRRGQATGTRDRAPLGKIWPVLAVYSIRTEMLALSRLDC